MLLDHSEPALFNIERELVDDRGFRASIPVLADVGNRAKLRQIFEKYRPEVVFHAAAYKHVPLLEANPLEAVRNNVLTTRTLAEVAVEFETRRFVLVSSDKAAQPKNLLGQSKAICEWIVQAYGAREDVTTRFVAVRFGNVLGSSGSVIPIFRKQIERGGPVTVTHRDMTRYFMTIPESVSLIVQAGAIGGRGHIYVLDMGEPVSIYELAENMIRLSGKVPERDIPIQISGVRPGEKLHEVLWNADESGEPTPHPKILAASQAPIDPSWLDAELRELERLVEEGDTLELVSRLTTMTREPQRLSSGTRRGLPRRSRHGPVRPGPRGFRGGAEPGAAARGRDCSRAGVHPRRGRLGEDDDDHAPDRRQVTTGAFAADEILAVTFTDKAAARAALPPRGARRAGVSARTFHAAALGQLRQYAPDRVGQILSSKALPLRRIANSLPGAYRFRPAGDLATEIEWAKNRRITPARYRAELGEHEPPIPADLMRRVYAQYEQRKAAAGYADFEDLLELAIRLFGPTRSRARLRASASARSRSTSTRT